MRHRVKKSFFNRGTKHRQAMLKNGIRNLIIHGEIVTTTAKAKEFKRLTDKIISKAMNDTVAVRRQLHQFFGKRDVVNVLVTEVAPILKGRNSGFTRITKHGYRRGDNSEMVKLELVAKPENLGTLKKPVVEEKKATKATKTKKATPKKTVAKKASSKKAAPKESKKTK